MSDEPVRIEVGCGRGRVASARPGGMRASGRPGLQPSRPRPRPGGHPRGRPSQGVRAATPRAYPRLSPRTPQRRTVEHVCRRRRRPALRACCCHPRGLLVGCAVDLECDAADRPRTRQTRAFRAPAARRRARRRGVGLHPDHRGEPSRDVSGEEPASAHRRGTHPCHQSAVGVDSGT
ncbi:Uncharacterised protein [Mycobacteroides abscessus subsp. abscessus]|nr:Uncharacterised protein [Mycobacteroides abscessus subsp. abscessus]